MQYSLLPPSASLYNGCKVTLSRTFVAALRPFRSSDKGCWYKKNPKPWHDFSDSSTVYCTSANVSSGLPTLPQGLTRRVHQVVPSHVCSFFLPQYRQPSAVTVTKPLITEILATTVHPFSAKLLLFFICPLPNALCSFLREMMPLHLFLLNTPLFAVELSLSLLPLPAATIRSTKGCPCASPLVSPVLPFIVGMVCFFLFL